MESVPDKLRVLGTGFGRHLPSGGGGGGNYYRTQRYKDADEIYAFKNRGFGGEIGLVGRTSGL